MYVNLHVQSEYRAVTVVLQLIFMFVSDSPPSNVKKIFDTFSPSPMLVLALTDASIGLSGTNNNEQKAYSFIELLLDA